MLQQRHLPWFLNLLHDLLLNEHLHLSLFSKRAGGLAVSMVIADGARTVLLLGAVLSLMPPLLKRNKNVRSYL